MHSPEFEERLPVEVEASHKDYFEGKSIWITPHALFRFNERIDPCAKHEDIREYLRMARYDGKCRKRDRVFYFRYQCCRFVVRRHGRRSIQVITVVKVNTLPL